MVVIGPVAIIVAASSLPPPLVEYERKLVSLVAIVPLEQSEAEGTEWTWGKAPPRHGMDRRTRQMAVSETFRHADSRW